jgi:hypothetical protein
MIARPRSRNCRSSSVSGKSEGFLPLRTISSRAMRAFASSVASDGRTRSKSP